MQSGAEPIAQFGEFIRGLLEERFSEEFTFGPIVVIPRTDHDGQDYLHTHIVFDGDQKNLDPRWTLRLSGRVWPHAERLGFPAIPIQSFVAKSEVKIARPDARWQEQPGRGAPSGCQGLRNVGPVGSGTRNWAQMLPAVYPGPDRRSISRRWRTLAPATGSLHM